MSLTIQAIAADCDAHVMYAASGRTDAQTAYLVNSINAAIEEMRVLSPQIFRKTYDLTWTGAGSQSVALTSNSKAWTGQGAPGSSVSIAGAFNELASSTTLLFPFTGGTGTVAATVYGDSVLLDGTVGRVLGGELLEERRPLSVLNSRAEWMQAQGLPWSHDYMMQSVDTPGRRQPGIPAWVWIESSINPAGAIEYRARCAPLPSGTFRATLDVETMVADVTANDVLTTGFAVSGTLDPDLTGSYASIGTDTAGAGVFAKPGSPLSMLTYNAGIWQLYQYTGAGSTVLWALTNGFPADPSGTYDNQSAGGTGIPVVAAQGTSTTRPVPGFRVYGILRALALYHWSGAPWFRDESARAVIQAGYQNAVNQLQGFQKNRGEVVRSAISYC